MGQRVFIVGGCGHVGLPFGLVLARAGLHVDLYDLDAQRVEQVRAGTMPFIEFGADELLKDSIGKTLHVVEEIEQLANADYVVITIGTPIDEYLSPQHRPLFDLAEQIAPHVHAGQHIVLRSTVFPGTTRQFARHLASMDLDVQLTYCPERIAQGHAIEELDKLPQIVSGFSPEAVESALRLFRNVTTRTLVVDVEEAELAKLFLNAWRYIQFATANQFYMIAEQRGFDFFNIYDAMTTGYGRADDLPLPGFTAGPCLLKDTLQLSALEPTGFQLGHAAMLVNEGLANFIVSRLDSEFDLASKTVGILGIAFKANIDDTRDSLAFKLRKILRFHGARVIASDPLAREDGLVAPEQLIADSDIVILGAPHDVYRDLVIPADTHLVDVWGFFPRTRIEAPTQ